MAAVASLLYFLVVGGLLLAHSFLWFSSFVCVVYLYFVFLVYLTTFVPEWLWLSLTVCEVSIHSLFNGL